MLALSMVVIAAMVGAPGLGSEVYSAVTQLKTGIGFEAGIAIVIVAITLDRITQNIKTKNPGECLMWKKSLYIGMTALLVFY